ncbi:MAG: hypothetical protein ACOZAI_06160 [Pseudomonadota bacterium]
MNNRVASLVLALMGIPAVQAAEAPVREMLKLSPEQAEHVRMEMRGFLVSLQGIQEGLARQDFEAVAKMARLSGRAAPVAAPPGLGKALPEAFRELGGATHMAFDQLAMDALEVGDVRLSLEQLGGVMQNCIQCHARYRLPD